MSVFYILPSFVMTILLAPASVVDSRRLPELSGGFSPSSWIISPLRIQAHIRLRCCLSSWESSSLLPGPFFLWILQQVCRQDGAASGFRCPLAPPPTPSLAAGSPRGWMWEPAGWALLSVSAFETAVADGRRGNQWHVNFQPLQTTLPAALLPSLLH